MATEKQNTEKQNTEATKEQAAENRKRELERYAKEAGLLPLNTFKGYLFPAGDAPTTDDLGTLVLTHDVAIEKRVLELAGKQTAPAPAERVSIQDALAEEVGVVVCSVMSRAKDMHAGRQLLRATFARYGGKEQAAYQDNELRPFADKFRQVAEAIHQELIAMANRAG